MELVTDNVIWTIKTRKNREISFPGENFIFFEVNLFRKKKKKRDSDCVSFPEAVFPKDTTHPYPRFYNWPIFS